MLTSAIRPKACKQLERIRFETAQIRAAPCPARLTTAARQRARSESRPSAPSPLAERPSALRAAQARASRRALLEAGPLYSSASAAAHEMIPGEGQRALELGELAGDAERRVERGIAGRLPQSRRGRRRATAPPRRRAAATRAASARARAARRARCAAVQHREQAPAAMDRVRRDGAPSRRRRGSRAPAASTIARQRRVVQRHLTIDDARRPRMRGGRARPRSAPVVAPRAHHLGAHQRVAAAGIRLTGRLIPCPRSGSARSLDGVRDGGRPSRLHRDAGRKFSPRRTSRARLQSPSTNITQPRLDIPRRAPRSRRCDRAAAGSDASSPRPRRARARARRCRRRAAVDVDDGARAAPARQAGPLAPAIPHIFFRCRCSGNGGPGGTVRNAKNPVSWFGAFANGLGPSMRLPLLDQPPPSVASPLPPRPGA